MEALFAARTGDKVGHSSSLFSWLGMGAGMAIGGVLGYFFIAAALATLAVAAGPLAIVAGVLLLGSAIAGGVAAVAGLGAAGEKLGEKHDEDSAEETAKQGSGEPILEGAPTVFIEKKNAATVDTEVDHGSSKITQGSKTVTICGKPASRVQDGTECGGKIVSSAEHTIIGGAQVGEAGESTAHKLGEWLEGVGKTAGTVSLVLFGLGALAGTAAAAVAGGVVAGLVSAGECLAAYGIQQGLSWIGKHGGGALGAGMDSAFGDKDGRWSDFMGELGENTVGFFGEKVKDVATDAAIGRAKGENPEGGRYDKGKSVGENLKEDAKGYGERMLDSLKELKEAVQFKEIRENAKKSGEVVADEVKAGCKSCMEKVKKIMKDFEGDSDTPEKPETPSTPEKTTTPSDPNATKPPADKTTAPADEAKTSADKSTTAKSGDGAKDETTTGKDGKGGGAKAEKLETSTPTEDTPKIEATPKPVAETETAPAKQGGGGDKADLADEHDAPPSHKGCSTCDAPEPNLADFTNPDGSVTYGPMNPGPLDAIDAGGGKSVGSTFRGGSYTERVLTEPLTLFRRWGGTAREFGAYWSRVDPGGPLAATSDNALHPDWGNRADNVTSITLPAGTTIYEGASAPQARTFLDGSGNVRTIVPEENATEIMGGGSQIYLPKTTGPTEPHQTSAYKTSPADADAGGP